MAEALPRGHEIYLTDTGREKLGAQPDEFMNMVDTAVQLDENYPPKQGEYEWIDRGKQAHVYGVDGSPDLCVKVMNKNTARKYGGLPPSAAVLETRFMHAVGARVARHPRSRVHIPDYYGVITSRSGAVILEERITHPYAPIKCLSDAISERGTTDQEQGQIALRRTVSAIGFSALLLGAGDMTGQGGQVNCGNFFIQKDKLANESDVYAIDLMGASFFRRVFARGALASGI